MRNVQAGTVAGAAIDIDFHYEEGDKGAFKPVVRNIEVSSLQCRKSKSAYSLRGFPDAPIVGVTMRHCNFESTAQQGVAENVRDLKFEDVQVNGQALK